MSTLSRTEACASAFQSGGNSVYPRQQWVRVPEALRTHSPALGIKSQMLFLMSKGEQETERKRRERCKWCGTPPAAPHGLRRPEVEGETRMCCFLRLCSSRSSGVRDFQE